MWITIFYVLSLAILISVTNGNFQEKIFIRASIIEHPHQVSIQYRNHHICGGAILSEFYVLSAANCLTHDKENVFYANLKVLSGTDNLEKLDMDSCSIHDVEYVVLHEKFELKRQRHDIAILRLTEPLIFNIYRWTVSSPYDRQVFPYVRNTHYYITGWGKNLYAVNDSNSIYPRLEFIPVEILNSTECRQVYFFRKDFNQNCLIATEEHLLKQGNGGSPIMENNEPVIVGIVSSVSIRTFQPSIYTRIHKYINWITTTIQE